MRHRAQRPRQAGPRSGAHRRQTLRNPLTPIPTIDATTDAVRCGESEIRYGIRRSRRRTVGIAVHADGSVVVRAPIRASLARIREFVRSRAAWVEKARLHFEKRPPNKAPPGYLPGESHRFLGQDYRLIVSGGGRAEKVDLLVGCLSVTTKGDPSEERVRGLVEKWYRDQAGVVFLDRLAVCHRLVAEAGIPFPEMRIRKMTSRWGSCSSAGRINLNLWLVKAPVACVDYVIVHELCHFKVKSHGPGFWKLVARFIPDYAELRRLLNANAG